MKSVASEFDIPGRFLEAVPFGSGHIHDTYLVRHETSDGPVRHVLQRINTEVFRNPVALMSNLTRISEHIRESLQHDEPLEMARRCLEIVAARSDRAYWVDAKGDYWRCLVFVERTRSIDTVEGAAQAYQAAHAFGDFTCRLVDLRGPALHETIPHFHDLAHRYVDLEEAAHDDPQRRRSDIQADIDLAARTHDALHTELSVSGLGGLPVRIVHNDCKINNVLFDEQTGEAMCVIDLDTVMPGTVLADFGELVRTSTCCAAEDETRLDSMSIEPELLQAVAHGYLDGAASILSDAERQLLPLAGSLMAFENAIRFLTDHLRGDVYFKVRRRGQNLDRFRAQLRLVELLEQHRDPLRAILETTVT